MSEEKKGAAETAGKGKDYWEEAVEYTAPLLGPRERRELLVSVNGETIRILRGEPVRIKRKHLEAIQNAQRQAYAAYAAMRRAQKQGSKALAAM